MIKRQRNAILLVALACLVVLICTAQRMAGMHALVMNVTATSQSLMSVPPVLFEGALIAVTLLLALLAASPPRRERQWPPRVISPPRLRVHLRLCVFRE